MGTDPRWFYIDNSIVGKASEELPESGCPDGHVRCTVPCASNRARRRTNPVAQYIGGLRRTVRLRHSHHPHAQCITSPVASYAYQDAKAHCIANVVEGQPQTNACAFNAFGCGWRHGAGTTGQASGVPATMAPQPRDLLPDVQPVVCSHHRCLDTLGNQPGRLGKPYSRFWALIGAPIRLGRRSWLRRAYRPIRRPIKDAP